MPHLRSDNDVRRGEKKTGFARCRGIFRKGRIASLFVAAVVIHVVDVVVVGGSGHHGYAEASSGVTMVANR